MSGRHRKLSGFGFSRAQRHWIGDSGGGRDQRVDSLHHGDHAGYSSGGRADRSDHAGEFDGADLRGHELLRR
jgi:hypothetical protein